MISKIKNYIGVISLGITLTFVFIFLMFPFGDLGDLVSTKVSEATQGSVFVQFDDMNISILPNPAVDLTGVSFESPFSPALSADEVHVKPSVGALISKEPLGDISAEGLFGGQLKVSLKKGTPTEVGEPRKRLLLTAESLNLAKVHEALRLPIAIEGRMNIESEAQANLEWNEQPEADLTLKVEKFILPPSTVNTMMGPLALPDLRLAQLKLKGRLSNGKFIIENGSIGNANDELFGEIKGNWAITFQKGGGFSPILGAYNLDIDFSAKKSFETKAALFLSFLDAYKTEGRSGSRFKFRVSSTSLDNPPNITASR